MFGQVSQVLVFWYFVYESGRSPGFMLHAWVIQGKISTCNEVCDDYKQYIYHMCEDKIKGYIFAHVTGALCTMYIYVPIIYFYTR